MTMIQHKKGEGPSHVIMWLGILLTVIISVSWLVTKISPRQLQLEKTSIDLESVQGKINAACNSDYYMSKYNPLLSDGVLILNNSDVCVSGAISLCRSTLCRTNISSEISLSKIHNIIIKKNETFTFYAE